MAKVATQGPLSSDALHFGGRSSKGGTSVKRKTPSELRGEQLKRKNVVELVDESPAPYFGSPKNTDEVIYGLKKDTLKNPRYIGTRINEVYPVRKNDSRLRLLSRKENGEQENSVGEQSGSLKSCSVTSDSAAQCQQQVSRLEGLCASTAGPRDDVVRDCKTTEKCGENTFRSVTELSCGGEKLSGLESVDLDKALKGLVAHEPLPLSGLPGSSERLVDVRLANLCSEFHRRGCKAPLDFTLKTTMRVMSSSSINWFHRLIACGTNSGVPQYVCSPQVGFFRGKNMSCFPEHTSTTQIGNLGALHSWVYPQSCLPPSIISAMTLAVAGAEMDFLSKRQLAWEDAFRSLYYMLRKSVCGIFYVCTSQFVVMFIGEDGMKETKRACSAYISRSTRSLRSLLKEHDICFSMPLCHSKVEQVNTEDLVELSEMEKHNLGQIRRQLSTSDVDNSPQSLLAFCGNENVHGLYDFLLNYRFFLTSLIGVDVPVLYSPVPFQNSAHTSPEVRCKEVKMADHIAVPLKEYNVTDEPNQGSTAGFCYSIEIKDEYLPPWVICSVFHAMSSVGISFEVSFVTESSSAGLNVGLETICQKFNPQDAAAEGLEESSSAFGIPNATFSPHLRSAFLRSIKYSDGSYTASILPV